MMYIKKQEERISGRDINLNELVTPPPRHTQQDGWYIIRGIDYIFIFGINILKYKFKLSLLQLIYLTHL